MWVIGLVAGLMATQPAMAQPATPDTPTLPTSAALAASATASANAAAAAVQVPAVANITTEIFFDVRSARLSAKARAALDKWLQSTEGVKADFILAIGHTDPGEVASAEKAVKLAEQRGEAVRAHLAAKGIVAGTVYVEGKGDTQPVSIDNTPAQRARNRRVDVGMVGSRLR